MGRFDVCVHLVINIMHVEDQVMYFLNDMCCEVGWLGRKKFLVEAVVGLFCGCYRPGYLGKGTLYFFDVDVDAAILPCCFGRMTGLGSGGVP